MTTNPKPLHERLRDLAGTMDASSWPEGQEALLEAASALEEQAAARPVAWVDPETFDCLTKNPYGAIAYHRWLAVGASDPFQKREIPLYAAPAAAQGAQPAWPLIALGFGKAEVASGTHEEVPALIFGRNGSGVIGEPTQSNRVLAHEDTLAVVTVANFKALSVVQMHINEIRAKLRASPQVLDGEKAE